MDPSVSYRKIIDLTLTLSSDIAGFSSKPTKFVAQDGWNASELVIYSHAGTHMDAPFHFGISEQTIDQLPIERFVFNCHLIQLKVETDNYLIGPGVISDLESKLNPGDGIIIETGWSKYLMEKRYRDGLPRISKELAEWFVAKKIGFLGVESPSIADVNNLKEVTLIHQILLGNNMIIVEGLTNLDQLTRDQFTVIALPLKIKGGDGAPARIIAFEE